MAQCKFQDCVTDAVKIFPMRTAFPPIRIFRRWIGLDPVPVIGKLESHLEKVKKGHEENIEGLRVKLEKLQDQQSEE